MAHQLNTNTSTLQSVLDTINSLPEAIDITAPLSELNAANGGTAATTIGAAVDNAEAHASNQEALIAQIASALEGKAVIREPETCTVEVIDHSGNHYMSINYLTYNNGAYNCDQIVYDYHNNDNSIFTLQNVVCNTPITFILCTTVGHDAVVSSNIQELSPINPGIGGQIYDGFYMCTSPYGGTIEIYLSSGYE